MNLHMDPLVEYCHLLLALPLNWMLAIRGLMFRLHWPVKQLFSGWLRATEVAENGKMKGKR